MKSIGLPESVDIVPGPHGPRLRGPALSIRRVAESLRALAEAPLGATIRMGTVELYVTDDPYDPHAVGRIALPRDAWNIMASKFVEVTAGWEGSPFDFGDCGYLFPRPDPDLGVVLVGKAEPD